MDETDTRVISGPMVIALALVFCVWVGGAIFNFSEQERYAALSGFSLPFLLPLLLDGLSIALASVATAASLDGRAAIVPRFGTIIAVGASSWVSGQAAALRAHVRVDTMSLETTWEPNRVIIGVGVPLFSLLAFEVLLVEFRRLVQKRRGRRSPVPIPAPRLVMWIAQPPWRTYAAWRRSALEQCRRELEIIQGQAVSATVAQVTVIEPTTVEPAAPRLIRSAPATVQPVGDRIEAFADILRVHGRDLGVTRFRELAREQGLACPNGQARDLLDTARGMIADE